MRKSLALLLSFSLNVSAQSLTGQTVTRSGLSVTYRSAADRAQLGRVFEVWSQAERDLKTRGLVLPSARLTASRNAADFAALTGYPAQIAAITTRGTIYTQRLAALQGKGLLPFTLRHEAFHLAQPPGLPRWLAEGLARIFSGEAQADRAASTGLEALSSAELDARLRGGAGAPLNAAYLEATRRAARLLAKQGWESTLKTR